MTLVLVVVSTVSSYRLTKKSKDLHNKINEMDLMLRMGNRTYDSKKGKKIMELAKDADSVVVDLDNQDGVEDGPLSHRDMESFLNDVKFVFVLKERGITANNMFQQTFSWVIDLIIKNKSIMLFIDKKQQEYGDVAWKPISDYCPKSKIRFRSIIFCSIFGIRLHDL